MENFGLRRAGLCVSSASDEICTYFTTINGWRKGDFIVQVGRCKKGSGKWRSIKYKLFFKSVPDTAPTIRTMAEDFPVMFLSLADQLYSSSHPTPKQGAWNELHKHGYELDFYTLLSDFLCIFGKMSSPSSLGKSVKYEWTKYIIVFMGGKARTSTPSPLHPTKEGEYIPGGDWSITKVLWGWKAIFPHYDRVSRNKEKILFLHDIQDTLTS